MSNNIFNGNITATNLHIGDIHNYSSPQDFITKNPNLNLSKTTKELVDLIFKYAPEDHEQQQILDSLKTIYAGDGTEEEKTKSTFSSKPVVKFLTDTAQKLGVTISADFLENHFTDISVGLKNIFS